MSISGAVGVMRQFIGGSQAKGMVLAVTHDRWFAASFDRFLVFAADGTVKESPVPVWD